eukprot:Opistho-2@42131
MASQLSLLPQDLAALRGLLGVIGDPMLLLNEALEVTEANPPAEALLGGAPSRGLKALHTSHGGRLGDWLRLASRAVTEGRRPPAAPSLNLPAGQRASLNLVALEPAEDDSARWLLHARIEGKPAAKTAPRGPTRSAPL